MLDVNSRNFYGNPQIYSRIVYKHDKFAFLPRSRWNYQPTRKLGDSIQIFQILDTRDVDWL